MTPSHPIEPIRERFPALEVQEVTFTFYAPEAKAVHVVGGFNDWNPAANSLQPTGSGEWIVRLMLKSGQYEYRFVVDGVWTDDPRATGRSANPFGGLNSVVAVGLDD